MWLFFNILFSQRVIFNTPAASAGFRWSFLCHHLKYLALGIYLLVCSPLAAYMSSVYHFTCLCSCLCRTETLSHSFRSEQNIHNSLQIKVLVFSLQLEERDWDLLLLLKLRLSLHWRKGKVRAGKMLQNCPPILKMALFDWTSAWLLKAFYCFPKFLQIWFRQHLFSLMFLWRYKSLKLHSLPFCWCHCLRLIKLKTMVVLIFLQVNQKGSEKPLEQAFATMVSSLGNGMIRYLTRSLLSGFSG